ncbi:VanZ family protein [Planctomycetota bacterium]
MIKTLIYFNTKRLLIAAIFTVTLIFLTHLPEQVVPEKLRLGGFDKLAHILAYGAITFLFIFSLRASLNLLIGSFILLGILVIAAFDELTQPLVNRTASLADWLADIAGICVVIAFKTWKSSSIRRQAKTKNQTIISED